MIGRFAGASGEDVVGGNVEKGKRTIQAEAGEGFGGCDVKGAGGRGVGSHNVREAGRCAWIKRSV